MCRETMRPWEEEPEPGNIIRPSVLEGHSYTHHYTSGGFQTDFITHLSAVKVNALSFHDCHVYNIIVIILTITCFVTDNVSTTLLLAVPLPLLLPLPLPLPPLLPPPLPLSLPLQVRMTKSCCAAGPALEQEQEQEKEQ